MKISGTKMVHVPCYDWTHARLVEVVSEPYVFHGKQVADVIDSAGVFAGIRTAMRMTDLHPVDDYSTTRMRNESCYAAKENR